MAHAISSFVQRRRWTADAVFRIKRGNLAIGTALAELMLARLTDQAPLASVLNMIAPTLIVPTKTD